MVLAIKAEKISRNRDPHTQLFEGHDFKRQDTRVALREPHTQPFGSGTTLNVGFGGRWDNASSYDIDMYKNPANTFIYRNGSTLNTGAAGTAESYHGQGGRKWLIWEVTEE